MDTQYRAFLDEISRFVDKKRIYTDDLRLLAWGTDAGFYRLTPQIVIRSAGEAEVSQLLAAASRHRLPVTFRAAGTSLSGQSITDSILIVAGKNWEKYSISPDGETARFQPGLTGLRANMLLAPYGKIFGPDPASKNSAMIGGIVMNNASGMSCGVHANSDRVLKSVRIVFADGTVLDTADEKSCHDFEQTHRALIDEIVAIRDAVRTDNELSDLIKYKYSIKNVTGLNIRPFVAFESPFEIIAHLMVGSEGTLAFLSEVTVATSHLYPYGASAMVYFDDMAEACRAVVAMRKSAPVYSCEMLDRKSLESVNDTTGKGLTALLIEVKGDSEAELKSNIDTTLGVINGFKLFKPAEFSSDPAVTSKWWQIRSGVFPTVGGTRPLGTTALIEDIAFHIEDLPEATVALAKLLEDAGYDDACIYGHALEGNYHFVIAQSFKTQADIDRYRKLMVDIERLVVDRFHGSLKAEHGTGRNMAPFVRAEWGDKAWEIMRRVKSAFDPENILNRGVIFNDDPECYIKNLKPLPLTDPDVDRCIECGFCEINCVSCGLTLSARQRIIVSREISRLTETGEDPARLKRLKDAFVYYGCETCAGDGLCSTSCPMKINTAELIHHLREKALPSGSAGYNLGKWCADKLPAVEGGLRLALGAADIARSVIGGNAVNSIGRGLHKIGLPLWTASLPKPYSFKKKEQPSEPLKAVYFPSCINRTMGVTPAKGDDDRRPLVDVMVSLCNKAGYEVIFPENMKELCCGMIWESKGMPDIADSKTAELERALLKASQNGKYPVFCDQSPCLHRMKNHIKSIRLYEGAEFIHDFLAPHLDFTREDISVAVHVTCSSRLMGLTDKIVTLASMCATGVTVPAEVGCCGFAGDKGFTRPELNKWGLRKLRPALEKARVTEGYSNSRTCEIGLTTNSGINYKSIAYLVDRCTSSKK